MQRRYHRSLLRSSAALLVCVIALFRTAPVDANVLLQGFYWDVPSPGAGNSTAPWWWDHLATQANALRQSGFSAIWIPPVRKSASGGFSNGYDPFDEYDLGSKTQQGTYPTRYGTREQLERCVAMLRASGLDVYVDMVDNHRNGDDGAFNFHYLDAYGNANAGRFQKGPNDFHGSPAGVAQDPNVPLGAGEDFNAFGRDLAPINGSFGSHYIQNGLNAAGDWLTKALDIQGFRLDYVKGQSTQWLRPFLDYGAMSGKFAVGEYFDGDVNAIQNWIQNNRFSTGMENRSSAFDFPLRYTLKAMCNNPATFNMATLDHNGLTGINPLGSVTFVENHDTDRSDPIVQNKPLAYAYILTSEGYPSVFYRDYSTDAGSYGLKTTIDNLIWVHENLASGSTQQRFKNNLVFVYERQGGSHLLVGLNNNIGFDYRLTCQAGFGGNVRLHDYTGHSADVFTNSDGTVNLDLPAAVNGQGYCCYAPAGITGSFPVSNLAVTQEYAGAQDLDIKPADNTALVQTCRLFVGAGKSITGSLFYDTTAWTISTRIYLELDDPTGAPITTGSYFTTTTQGTSISTTAGVTGWYTFRIRSYNTPSANLKPYYFLKATYTAPQTFDAANLSSQMQISRSGLTYNSATGRYSGTLTVVNGTGHTVAGPIEVALYNLTAGVSLYNRSGATGDGTPYIGTSTTLAPGSSVTINLQFTGPNGVQIGYTNKVYAGTF